MRALIFLVIITNTIQIAIAHDQEIHCKHILFGIPKGTPESNDIIIRDIYALSSNDETKIADWVAYRLDRKTISGNTKTTRNWKADKWLDETETLEPNDYKGAYKLLKTDRGHQAPLANFKGTDCWHETNYLSNITPQRSRLNRNLWKILEIKIRNLVKIREPVYVLTGTLFEKEMKLLPGADELHKVPSGYWKVVYTVKTCPRMSLSGNDFQYAAFIFNQECDHKNLIDHVCTIDEIEKRTGLNFFYELENEDKIEKEVGKLLFW